MQVLLPNRERCKAWGWPAVCQQCAGGSASATSLYLGVVAAAGVLTLRIVLHCSAPVQRLGLDSFALCDRMVWGHLQGTGSCPGILVCAGQWHHVGVGCQAVGGE